MAEILGAVSACANLLENALSVIKSLRKAQKRQKDLICVLVRHEDELDSIKMIFQQLEVEENSELRTAPSLGAELARMQQVQQKLDALLKELHPGSKKSMNQFARQLLEGSSDEKRLSSIMDELAQIKASILLCIQMASVGVMHDMNKQIVADAAKIERIDSNLQKAFDDYEGLRIARLIKDRRPSVDGTIPLTQADLQSLSSLGDDSDHASGSSANSVNSHVDTIATSLDIPVRVERIIHSNEAGHQAFQVNSPVGEDIWKDLGGRLEIRDNVAKNQATQFNHAISLDAALSLMKEHGKNIKTVFASRRRKR